MSSGRRSLLIAAIAACASMVVSAAECVRDVAASVLREPISQHEVATPVLPLAKPRVMLVSARSFVARLMRRERPALSPGWRMCPSV